MACEKPKTAYRPANGGPLYWTPPTDGRAAAKIEIPCGSCILCREEQARQWAVRLTHEQTLHDEACFGTLTYDDKFLPTIEGTPTLNYAHTHDFVHRARKYVLRKYGRKISYYLVGEYGDKSNRPHYHFAMFGHAFTEKMQIIRTSPTVLWTSQELAKLWGHGYVSIGALTFESAQYTASYVTKKLRAKQQYVRVDEVTGELIPLVQPRAFVSTKPAIGKRWWELWHQGVIDHDHVIMNGRRQKPPKYYDRLLEKKDKQLYDKMKEKRNDSVTRDTPETAHARAEVARARAKNKKKSI